MGIQCTAPAVVKPIVNFYSVTQQEFANIFADGVSDAPVVLFAKMWISGELLADNFPFLIEDVPVLCSENLGDYEDVSSLDVLLALLNPSSAPSLAAILRRNLRRALSVKLCTCFTPTSPDPDPDPDPLQPLPDIPVPDGCCSSCFAPVAESVNVQNAAIYSNIQALVANGYTVDTVNPPVLPSLGDIPFTSTLCDGGGNTGNYNTCKYYIYNGGVFLSKPGSEDVNIGFNVQVFFSQFCQSPTPPDGDGDSQPPPDPLPPDTFDFCLEFPSLCNDCPECPPPDECPPDGIPIIPTTLTLSLVSNCSGSVTSSDYTFKIKSEGADAS